jgi:hypothetical protein
MWLKKLFDRATDGELIRKAAFADETSIADFGVGKNMVASIRHWALACGVMLEDGDNFRICSLAKEILCDGGLDPYAESPSSAWLVHWQLAGSCFRSTTWLWTSDCPTNKAGRWSAVRWSYWSAPSRP